MRHRADNNRAEIVGALRKVGCSVCITEHPLDLLIYSPFTRETSIADCKAKKGTLTPEQKKFAATWKGPWYLLRSVDEALELVGAR